MCKYIILGNGNDWCELSFYGIENRNDIVFFNSKLPLDMNKISSKLARYYFSNTLNKRVKLPFKKLWYKKFYNNLGLDSNSEQVLIIYDKNMLAYNWDFLSRVKSVYPKIKLVYAFTNVVKFSGAILNDCVEKLNDYYDVVLAFDPIDSKKYNFDYSPLVCNTNLKYCHGEIKQQVFYVGTAKDRLHELKAVCRRLDELGISYDFNITEVPEDEIDNSLNITYNKRKSYLDVLDHISSSGCILDVIQGESSGLTLKTCEAVCYDKKLITTNKHIVEYPFYKKEYVLIIETANDITSDFLRNYEDVHYSTEDKAIFSTDAFLSRIDAAIELKRNNS